MSDADIINNIDQLVFQVPPFCYLEIKREPNSPDYDKLPSPVMMKNIIHDTHGRVDIIANVIEQTKNSFVIAWNDGGIVYIHNRKSLH